MCDLYGYADSATLEIRNFLGQKIVRRVHIPTGISIVRSEAIKDQLELQGSDVELLGQTAATIHQSCTVKNKDIRKFLDGIYVSQKGLIGEFNN